MRKMEQQAAALVAGAVVQPNKTEEKRYVYGNTALFFLLSKFDIALDNLFQNL